MKRTVALFVAAILAGAAAGLLVGLIWVRVDADPVAVTPPAVGWPAATRCGVRVQPEDLDRAADCPIDPADVRHVCEAYAGLDLAELAPLCVDAGYQQTVGPVSTR